MGNAAKDTGPTDPIIASGGCTAQRLADLVNRLGRGVHCLQFADGLNPAQWDALRYIGRANRYSRNPSALASYLKITKGTASQTIKALESKGLVTRQPHCTDGRAVHLVVTTEGESLLQRDPLKRLEGAIKELGTGIDAAKLVLCELIDGVEDASGKRGFGVCEDCTHFCRNEMPNDSCGPHQCGLTLEALSGMESSQICVDHNACARV